MKELFPQLVRFLEKERDQVEFLQLVQEIGLGPHDVELAKLLVALQLYKGYYADIPRQIRKVHGDALAEIRRVRDEMELLSDRVSSDGVKVGQWASEIHRALQEASPKDIATQVHKRLAVETVELLSGALQGIGTASRRIEGATNAMDKAGHRAAICIDHWEAVSLRRIWTSAFCFCLVASLILLTGFWFLFLRHQGWWLSLQ